MDCAIRSFVAYPDQLSVQNYSQDGLTTNACQAQIFNVDSVSNVIGYSASTIGTMYKLSVSQDGSSAPAIMPMGSKRLSQLGASRKDQLNSAVLNLNTSYEKSVVPVIQVPTRENTNS